jgi:hypothetical protein
MEQREAGDLCNAVNATYWPSLKHRLLGLDIRSNTHFEISIYAYC